MADILSQDEVDLLLNAVSEGDTSPEVTVSAGTHREEPSLTTYDFRRPERVSKEQLKGLQSFFEAFSREVSVTLPPFLRTVIRVDLTSIDQLTYDEFILSVARPTSLTVINMRPLEGTAVLELSPSVVFPIVDRVLGGKGIALPEPRELTEIENRIMHRLIVMILDSLKRSWEQLVDFRLSVVNMESDPLIVQIVAGSEMVILIGYEFHIGEAVGTMNFCIPLMVLNPILDQMAQQAHFVRKMSDEEKKATKEAMRYHLMRVPLSLDMILGRATLPLDEVSRLQVGDVVQLNSDVDSPIEVNVGNVLRFLARPGRRGEYSAVQIEKLIKRDR